LTKITIQYDDKEHQSTLAIGTVLEFMGYETNQKRELEIRVKTSKGLVRITFPHDEACGLFKWSRQVHPYREIL
jgi:hypothetical protein